MPFASPHGLFIALLLALAPPAQASTPLEDGLNALRAMDIRVATIGYRIATSNTALCADRLPLSGMLLDDPARYRDAARATAERVFGLSDGPAVEGVVPDGPADQAGLAAGDSLIAIDGQPIRAPDPATVKAQGSYAALQAVLQQLDGALARGTTTVRIRRGGAERDLRLKPVEGCASLTQVIPSDSLDAGADGRLVSLTSGLVGFLGSDDGLALVIAHEIAHNALRHRRLLDCERVSRGLFRIVGRNAALIRDTEERADYLALYLMARGGYDITVAPDLWRRLGDATEMGFLSDPTHPRGLARARAAETEIAEIRTKAATGAPLVPGVEGQLQPLPAPPDGAANRCRPRRAKA